LIDRFIAGEIKSKGKDKSRNTLQNYNTVKGHLIEYQLKTKTKLTFDKINLDFFYSYVSFLQKYTPRNSKEKGLAQNTISKDITTLKVFMSEAVDMGLTTNMQFRHKKFTVQEEATDAVYLNDREINAVYKLDLSENQRLERARDLFVFGCYVGLRYSDYSTIKPENIISIDGDLFIKLITTKTKTLVIIPCSPVVLEIFEKYKDNTNSLPRSYSNQKFNEYVKEVCEKAGLVEIGRLSTAPEKKLFESISSHTARRSFATNLYLDGFPTIEIMKITAHTTEKSFLKYIKVSKLDAAKRLSAFMKKRWSEKMLRVA
ncbi:MAG: phage integrase SAM-like domain-containing protein, partial [Ginsengibacter sp.]